MDDSQNGDLQPEDAPSDAAVFQSMTLLATFQTASALWDAIRRRKAGRDPSADEPAPAARAYLAEATAELSQLYQQLVTSRVCTDAPDEERGTIAHSVRRFDELIKLQRAARLLHGMHQRLMSLYPDVDEDLLEKARLLHQAAERFPEGDAESYQQHISPFLQELFDFSREVELYLRRTST